MINFRGLTRVIDQKNIQKLVEHLLNKMNEGHTCIDINAPECQDLISGTDSLNDQNDWLGSPADNKPFVLDNGRLFLKRFYSYEEQVARTILSLVRHEKVADRIKRLNEVKDKLPKGFVKANGQPDWQWIACILGFINNFTIITGGPGTGKTTTVNRLLYILLSDNRDLKIKIAAPTGKAAARLKQSQKALESTYINLQTPYDKDIIQRIEDIPTSTLHALLGYIPNSITFRHNQTTPLVADVVIIDECSMIDLQLFKKLLEAIDPQKTKLILLGDKNQLPSIEMGYVLGDLYNTTMAVNQLSQPYLEAVNRFDPSLCSPEYTQLQETGILDNHIIELKKSYRFSHEKSIGKLSHAILNEDIEEIENLWEDTPEDLAVKEQFRLQECVDHWTSPSAYFYEEDVVTALKKIQQFTLLTPLNEGPSGVLELNRQIEQELASRNIISRDNIFYHNQLIIVTQNQPELGIYNGDMGIIREKSRGGDNILVAYFENDEGGIKEIIPLHIRACQSAYALSIHKSQGSEFDHVAIVLPESDIEHLLSKDLIYTAVTRAKERVSIFSGKKIFLDVCQRQPKRQTGLQEKIQRLWSSDNQTQYPGKAPDTLF